LGGNQEEDTQHNFHTQSLPTGIRSTFGISMGKEVKIDYWYMLKNESLLREQIDLLKSQLREKDDLIANLVKVPEVKVPEIPINRVSHEPVRRGVINPARALAEMEIKERERYWKEEISRREEAAKAEGNIITDKDLPKDNTIIVTND
jgi:hypothetical protein